LNDERSSATPIRLFNNELNFFARLRGEWCVDVQCPEKDRIFGRFKQVLRNNGVAVYYKRCSIENILTAQI
jgi:hypothetical protein